MKVFSLTAFSLMGFSLITFAQPAKKATSIVPKAVTTTPADDEEWLFSKYYDYLKQEVKPGKEGRLDTEAQKFANYINTDPELKAKKVKLYRTDYVRKSQFKAVAGESDRIALLKGIPAPKDPLAALQADPRDNEKYQEKIERLKEQAEAEARRIAESTDMMKKYKKEGKEGLIREAEDKADKNEIVKDMGGVQALRNMSEAERQEVAKKMVAKQTGGYTPEEIRKMTPEQRKQLAYQMAANKNSAPGSDGAAAFTQLLMSNPGYRAEYEKMSDAEKQKVYQDFLKANGSTHTQPVITKEMKENEQDAREAIELAKLSEKYQQELQSLFQPIQELEQRYMQESDAKDKKLSDWTAKEVENLPTVRDSEYGARKDGEERVLFTEAVLRYAIGQERVAKEREIWDRYLDAHITALLKLDEWTAVYEKREELSDRLKLHLAGLKASGFDSIIDLNKKAGHITAGAGSVQYAYNCTVLHNCADPRQDKYSAGK